MLLMVVAAAIVCAGVDVVGVVVDTAVAAAAWDCIVELHD
jgi:hypothetical protein